MTIDLDRTIRDLTPDQAGGLDYVHCGVSFTREAVPHVLVGRSEAGSQVFACAERCAEEIEQRHHGSDAVGNPRYLLRAFEQTDPTRTAYLAVVLLRTADTTTRDDLAALWAQRYPRHCGLTGRRSIRSRIGRGLSLLRLVHALTVDGCTVGRGSDPDALMLAASNLAAIENMAGAALPPSQWFWRPHVPDHLRAVQTTLIDAGRHAWNDGSISLPAHGNRDNRCGQVTSRDVGPSTGRPAG